MGEANDQMTDMVAGSDIDIWLLVYLEGFPFWCMKFWLGVQEWLGGDRLQQKVEILQCHVRAIARNLEGTSYEVRIETAVLAVSWKNKVGVVSFRKGRSAFSGWAKPFVMLILHPWSLVSQQMYISPWRVIVRRLFSCWHQNFSCTIWLFFEDAGL